MSFKTSTNHVYDTDCLATNDQVTCPLKRFKNHPSIIIIKNKKKHENMIKVFLFFLGPVTHEAALKKIKNS